MSAVPVLACEQATELAAGFLLGALEPVEMDAVRAHLASCRRPHPEFAELGGVVPHLAASLDPVEPRPSLRARVRSAVEAEVRGSSVKEAHADRPARRFGPRLALASWFTAARLGFVGLSAAVLILAGSTLYLSNQLDQSRSYADQLAAVARLAGAPGSRTAVLSTGSATTTVSGVAVLPGPDDRSTPGLLVVDGLAPTASPQVYEVWLIEGSAAPKPIGSFEVGPGRHGWFVGLPAAPAGKVTIALTRESGPGARTPTLPIVASGSPTT
jgi:Anti-sigma-K factor rskA, C-terminal/Putative zinc-finger